MTGRGKYGIVNTEINSSPQELRIHNGQTYSALGIVEKVLAISILEDEMETRLTVSECYDGNDKFFHVTETKNLPHIFIGSGLSEENLQQHIRQGTDVIVVCDLPITMIFKEDQEMSKNFKEDVDLSDVKNFCLIEAHNYSDVAIGGKFSWREVDHYIEQGDVNVILK